uniref:F-box domain-containing protein n=1 Tax=Leersia perrieri TaxID=77586 RepID=A0A0D9XIL7_9ORYZ
MAECSKEVKNGVKEIVGTNINDLPNDVLEHILSFLPTREVVQLVCSLKCVDIMESVPTVEIMESIEDCHNKLDHVILHRGDISIHTCHLHFVDYFHKANSWIFHALLVCKVKELSICVWFDDEFPKMANQSIISKHLRKLVLDTRKLKTNFVDFTSCPFLEDLDMTNCIITGNKIISNSVKHLRMESMVFRTYEVDDLAAVTQICVPNLGLLSDQKYGCLLLDHLSNTTHMELANDCRTIVPAISKHKTLVLNEWFLDNGLWGLLSIVKCSPSLEKITIKLYTEPEHMVGNEESHSTMVQSFVMKQLKKISVKCEKEMEWVKNIVMALTKFGIPQHIIFVEEILSSSQ